MTLSYTNYGDFAIHTGDCITAMQGMDPGSAQMCVTSPPYFGLRDYGCAGQIGLEQTPGEYVAKMVDVFREVRRVLRDDGTLWLNLGDSYNGYMANQRGTGLETKRQQARKYIEPGAGLRTDTMKNKDLMGMPWRVAFALQADGWYLRQDIIWHKPNPMPESVRDRCTKAHEYIFLLSKNERYYFDADAMQEPTVGALPGNKNHRGATASAEGDEKRRPKAGLTAYCERQRSKRDSFKRDNSKRAEVIPGQTVGTHRADREESDYDTATRNRRSVWTVATRPYKGAHFATYPPALVEPCVLAGSRPGDTILDPFGGSGTTGEVAVLAGRRAVLCELNPEYVALAERRIATALWGPWVFGPAPLPKAAA